MSKQRKTLEEVIKDLKRKGWNVEKHPDKNLWNVYWKTKYTFGIVDVGDYFTERELYVFHSRITERPNRVTRNTKIYTKVKDRAATRAAIKTEQFDKIPQNKQLKPDNPRNWD